MNNQEPSRQTEDAKPGLSAAACSVKSRYWRVTRLPENQRQFPGEYSTRHILTVEATQAEAQDWATGHFTTDTIVKVELWPGAPVSPNE